MSDKDGADIVDFLQHGALQMEGMLPWSSNYTFLVKICDPDTASPSATVTAVYKPRRGERPLWDFARGTLCQREHAAYLVSEALGWGIVPPTVLRRGPQGIGSVQLFIDHDPEQHYFTFEGDPALRPQLQKIALFDILVNNADRKSGHVLLEERNEQNDVGRSGRLWGIDHGICFHTDYKLRTVIWEFTGQPIPDALRQDLIAFARQLKRPGASVYTALAERLSSREMEALQRRLTQLIGWETFPDPGPGRHYPWPPV